MHFGRAQKYSIPWQVIMHIENVRKGLYVTYAPVKNSFLHMSFVCRSVKFNVRIVSPFSKRTKWGSRPKDSCHGGPTKPDNLSDSCLLGGK